MFTIFFVTVLLYFFILYKICFSLIAKILIVYLFLDFIHYQGLRIYRDTYIAEKNFIDLNGICSWNWVGRPIISYQKLLYKKWN